MFLIKQAMAPMGPDSEFDGRVKNSELGRLLADGWEPFAVTCMPYTGSEYVWLRKKVAR